MKKNVLLLVLISVITGYSSLAQDEVGPQKYFELFGYASLNNSYLIGSQAQKWMNDDIKSGSPAFFNIGGTSYMPVNQWNTMHVGIGFSLNVPPSHSIWGSNLYFGGRNELVLQPYILSMDLPLRFSSAKSGLSLTLDPALLMNVLTGKYSTNGTVNVDGKALTGEFSTNMGSMGVGFGFGVSAEYYLGFFGIGVKYGARILKSGLSFNDSSVGAWSPSIDNKDVKIDLGGSYLTIGIMLKMGKKDF